MRWMPRGMPPHHPNPFTTSPPFYLPPLAKDIVRPKIVNENKQQNHLDSCWRKIPREGRQQLPIWFLFFSTNKPPSDHSPLQNVKIIKKMLLLRCLSQQRIDIFLWHKARYELTQPTSYTLPVVLSKMPSSPTLRGNGNKYASLFLIRYVLNNSYAQDIGNPKEGS